MTELEAYHKQLEFKLLSLKKELKLIEVQLSRAIQFNRSFVELKGIRTRIRKTRDLIMKYELIIYGDFLIIPE